MAYEKLNKESLRRMLAVAEASLRTLEMSSRAKPDDIANAQDQIAKLKKRLANAKE